MRRILLILTVAFLFTSCYTYQYVTLDAPGMSKNDKKEMVWENDTMKLVYNFNGEAGPMSLSLFNKTDKPLYINWKKSSLIRNANSVSLFNPTVIVSGVAATAGYASRSGYSRSTTGFTASFDLPEGVDFIPPGSYANKALSTVMLWDAVAAANTEQLPSEKITNADGLAIKYKRIVFDEHQSPVYFSVYLTFVLGFNNNTEFAVQHSFYAKEVLASKVSPDVFSLYNTDGDRLYTKRAQ
jgi:hypothetical protein